MSLTPHPEAWPFSFEKWYIDTLLPDGSVLIVYLGRMHLLGLSLGRVNAELLRPGRPPLKGHAIARRVEGDGDTLRFGSTTIDGEWLSFRTAGLSGELSFRALHPPAALGRPFVTRGRRRLDWTVEVPDAEVTGVLHSPEGRHYVAGRGYRDHVWMDLEPWRFPIRRLVWGRAAAGEQSATWVRAETADRTLHCRWLNGEVVDNGHWPVTVDDSRVLLDTAIYDRDNLRLGALRPLLRRLYGEPQETKYAARATVGPHRGVAIHEVVTWH